jgi:hypothetical protein
MDGMDFVDGMDKVDKICREEFVPSRRKSTTPKT